MVDEAFVGREIRVAILSPLRVLHEALSHLLERQQGLRLIRPNHQEFAELLRAESAGLILLWDGSTTAARRGVQIAARRLSRCRVVVFGLRDSRQFARMRQLNNARGFVSRDATLSDILDAVSTVARGREFISPKLAVDMLRRAKRVPSRAGPPLTERENQIAQLLGKHLTNRQIGARFGLSEHTIKVHVRHILAKLQVEDRSQVRATLLEHSGKSTAHKDATHARDSRRN